MSSQCNNAVAEKGHSGPCTYDVQCTGTHKMVCITESAASKAAPSAPILVTDAQLTPSQVQQLVATEFGTDEGYNEFPLNMRTQKEVDELCMELEAEIQDTVDTYIHTSAAGEVLTGPE
ncbi:unnamed protein product [Rhizoctonia solani]|uniref:Uncharacterized protein n=1 Tax=Rhizoctonia solani TaxID=456999 RepID=A0A8H3HEJ2_9AGAM|nr:unnamed protein product [Rhizoctonia solani]